MVYDVESGNTLADAFSKHPKAFSAALRQHGGRGRSRRYPGHDSAPAGHLPREERRPRPQGEGRHDLPGRHHHGGGRWPSAILLIFVIPTFQSMFASANLELPLPTRVVIGMSNFLISYWWAMLAAVGGVDLRHPRATTPRRPAASRSTRLLLKAPVLGDVIRKSAVSRFTRTLGTLVSSGVLDPRGPRDHGQDRRQPGGPQRRHGVAPVASRAARPSRRRWRSRRSSRRWSSR